MPAGGWPLVGRRAGFRNNLFEGAGRLRIPDRKLFRIALKFGNRTAIPAFRRLGHGSGAGLSAGERRNRFPANGSSRLSV